MRFKCDRHWHDLTYEALQHRTHRVADGLRSLDLNPGDRVALLSENRPEWAMIDYACLSTRLVDVPIYPTITAAQLSYILRDSGARTMLVSSRKHLARVLALRHELPGLESIVLFDAESGQSGESDVMSLAALEEQGEQVASSRDAWEASARSVSPDDLATLIYTSGTSGDPKGVMLSHGNIASNVMQALQVLPITAADECLSFLPLCHIFERMVGHYAMLQAGAVITYASSIEAAARELPEVRPTIVASVPRLYHKIHAAAVARAASGGWMTRTAFGLARRAGNAAVRYRERNRPMPPWTALAVWVSRRLVFARLHEKTGGRIRFCVSGGAALNPDVCRFLLGAGITVFEGYGLTETSPVIAANTFTALRPGTVGRPIPGIEVEIAHDGEILTRGPHVMQGYFHRPEATAEAIDRDGWFHTGDVGEFDTDGFLHITDRKKDLFKTAGGKYVAPQPIEARLTTSPFFSHAVMFGDQRKFPVMLAVPDFAAVWAWARAQQFADPSPAVLLSAAVIRQKLEHEARQALGDLAPYETPRKFHFVLDEFTVESGELTPSLKVRRRVVEERYREQIEAMYRTGEA